MTPNEVFDALVDLGVIWTVQARVSEIDKIGDALGISPQESEDEFISEEEKEKIRRERRFLDTTTDKKKLRVAKSWFLGANPPEVIEDTINGTCMTCTLDDKRRLVIYMEDAPYGANAGQILLQIEYIRDIKFNGGTLYFNTQVGDVALRIHEVTADQCKAEL